MRDFRDAKAMAHALRDALKSRAVETTHSESLELIAKAFGYDNWNILAAKIEAAEPRGGATPTPDQRTGFRFERNATNARFASRHNNRYPAAFTRRAVSIRCFRWEMGWILGWRARKQRLHSECHSLRRCSRSLYLGHIQSRQGSWGDQLSGSNRRGYSVLGRCHGRHRI